MRWQWLPAVAATVSLYCSEIYAYQHLTNETILHLLPKPHSEDFEIKNGPLLAPILIPRVPGTPGSETARNHLVDFFKSSLPEWTVEFQNSTSVIPQSNGKEVQFVNVIARREPPDTVPGNVGYLTLVAHYDSKSTPEGFIGATDSAAPCAMIMHAVRSIDAALTRKWESLRASGIDPDLDEDSSKSIQVLFLDGEEAFFSWTDTDSLYGARSLAETWDNSMYPPSRTYKNRLNSIELFVLLDLLGSGEYTPVPSWMQDTHWVYQHLAEMEQRLRQLGLFKSTIRKPWLLEKDKAHNSQFRSYDMQDDHIPFVARGVPILHLIPQHFPSVWHTMNDDGEHLDIAAVEDWSLLTSAFAAEFLELEGYFEATRSVDRKREEVISKTEL